MKHIEEEIKNLDCAIAQGESIISDASAKVSALRHIKEKLIKENEDRVGDRFSFVGTAQYELLLCFMDNKYFLIITKKISDGVHCYDTVGKTWSGAHDSIKEVFGCNNRSEFVRFNRQ